MMLIILETSEVCNVFYKGFIKDYLENTALAFRWIYFSCLKNTLSLL